MTESDRLSLQDNSTRWHQGTAAKHMFYQMPEQANNAWEACTRFDAEKKQHGLPAEFLGTLLVAAGNRIHVSMSNFDIAHFRDLYSNDVSGSFSRELINHRTQMEQLGAEAYVMKYAGERFKTSGDRLTPVGQTLMSRANEIVSISQMIIDGIAGPKAA